MSGRAQAGRRFTAFAVATVIALAGAAVHAHDDEHEGELDFGRAPQGTMLWGTLAKVGVWRSEGKLVRKFTQPIRQYDGKKVTLYGYVTLVDGPTSPHRMFLLSSQKIACRGCARPVEPEGIVEVSLKRPADLRRLAGPAEVLAVRGKLELVQDDATALLYRLADSEIVTLRSVNSH
ncbi:hypothetical protein QTI24_18925 [Variovorax sp. J22P240]|uniref:hypothetical protein n=1 Tax=Variovorax sp. J22P240 TaxID=3053514 RepID=UPI002578C8D1|nr:hypothetical protein [Variovorax sp. J22P240]MDM0000696.1 hypothetical protein [Variovorax sp. J22P240]